MIDKGIGYSEENYQVVVDELNCALVSEESRGPQAITPAEGKG
jgi:hypothetical protein